MLLATPWQCQDVNTTPPIPQQHGRDVCADTHQGPAASGGPNLPPAAAASDFVSLRVQSRWQADPRYGELFQSTVVWSGGRLRRYRMANQFRAQVYRDVAKHFREGATYASSSRCRIDIESTAHGYDLRAEGIERHGSIPPVCGRVDAVVVAQLAHQLDFSPAKKAATPPLQANTESPGPAS